MKHKYEKLLWSIAFPGFGQLLNQKYIKGVLFIVLEFAINVKANLNEVIVSSFHGHIVEAIELTDYGWLMFYPCVYLFAMWDAFKDAGGGQKPLDFLPFAFAAFTSTVGLIYSSVLPIFGVLWGPIFLPILSIVVGSIIGFVIKWVMIKRTSMQES